jgi:hypothetical protein
MESKPFGAQSIPEVPTRARRLQLSWRSPASHTRIGFQDQNAAAQPRITTWCLILLSVLGLSATVCAQKAKDSWSNLNGLRAGQGIEAIESSRKSQSGQFVTVTVTVTDEMFSLQEEGSGVSIKREDVVRVSTSSGPRRGEHAVIGLVVGGGIGAAIAALAGSSHGFFGWSDRGIAALVGIVIGGPERGSRWRSDPRSYNGLSRHTHQGTADDIARNNREESPA